jgi:hypothetical protein
MHDTIKFWTERAERHEADAAKFGDLYRASHLNAHRIVAEYHEAEARTCREYVRVDTAAQRQDHPQPAGIMGAAMAAFSRVFGGAV